jgi:hypothetical protein
MATLESRLRDFLTAAGTDFKATRAMIGTLASLNTSEKGSLVGALNEIRAVAMAASGNSSGATINDTTPTTTTTYSASKIESAITAARTVINDSAAALTTVYSSTKVNAQIAALIDDASTLTTKSWSAGKTISALAAKPDVNDTTAGSSSTYSSSKINAVVAALINDAVTVTGTTWSSNKIQTVVNAAVAGLVGSAPATLDTINELAAALGGDANAITAINTALGNRVRFDAAQTLTTAQKAQVKANIDAYGALEIGNPDTDFVAAYVLAKQ